MTNVLLEETTADLSEEPPQIAANLNETDEGQGSLNARHTTFTTRLIRGWERAVLLPAIRFFEGVILKRAAERLYLVFGGHIFFQTLRSAVQLDLFSILATHGPLTRKEIARTLEIEEQPIRIVLLGLTSCGLLKKRGEKYSNTYLSKRLFDSNSPENINSYVELEHQAMYKAMFWLHESVKESRNVGLKELEGVEPTIYERLAHNPDLERIFQNAMQELSVQANKNIVRFVDFSNLQHIVDVGGGDGTNAMQMVKAWPHLNATVFDLPSVCDLARDHIKDAGMSGQVSAFPGNCFEDEFPDGADCFLFCHFFTIWSEEKNRLLLKKAFDALPSGGVVLQFNMMQSNDESGPLSAAIGSPYFLTLATGEGMLYTWQEYESWMQDAGFRSIRKFKLPRDHGVIKAIKP